MVINNSEVSMTSTTSIARGASMTVQSEIKPIINLDGIKMLGDPGKTEKSEDVENENSSDSVKNEGDFMSSLNYALSKNGKVKEVEAPSLETQTISNNKVRMGTIEYLLRILLMKNFFGEDSEMAEYLKEKLGISDTSSAMGMGEISPVFVKKTTTTYTYWESQSVEYSSTGTAITADGRKLKFDYSFAMSSSFMEQCSVDHLSIKNCIDPLVINLDDNPTSITNQTFFFDLDGDGTEEEIHNLAAGSGFLALDKNEDGIINDGMELFGARTGDGFGELAAFDEDGNGWIDENDSIFSKLRIMTVNEQGERELYGLMESDVGAIYLGRIDTGFIHRDDENNPTSVLRETGMFLHEKDGRAGGVQHVDFTT